MRLQKQLKFAIKGENFLEYKREQIITQIKKYWPIFLLKRKEFIDLYKNALLLLNETYKEMGKRQVNIISMISKIQYKPRINISYLKELGNNFPQIDLVLDDKLLPSYSFELTSHHLDDLVELLKIFIKTLIELAKYDDIIHKLSFNYKKINRRINSLKNIIVPNLQLDIKKIGEILEESQRENFVRLKKTKDLISRKQKIL